ncbi:LAFA_0A00210g1_1 [Lachancea sp. 'fantastica']|nr:LAFA_0A00210g1_1 [Lachancea sp. 'fantastica']
MGSEIEIVKGTIEDLDVLEKAAAASDGVVHLGFIHDFNQYEKCCLIDRKATIAMLEALKGSNKPYVQTAVCLVFPPDVLGTETGKKHTMGAASLRSETEDIVMSYKDKGVRTSSVRLPPSVHGKGDQGFVTGLIKIANATGKSGYIGSGANVWPAVSRFDAGRLFKLALEKGQAGSAYHATADEGVKTKDIAETIGQLAGLPVESIEPAKAGEQFGSMSFFFSMGGPVSVKSPASSLAGNPRNLVC